MAANYNRVYLNNGSGYFVDVTVHLLPGALQRRGSFLSVALGDVDGNGVLDAVFGRRQARSLLYLNDGTGALIEREKIQHADEFTAGLACADVDGDGDQDVFLGNGLSRSEQNRLLLNDGNGFFSDVTATHLPAGAADQTLAAAAGDVDGDGDADLFVGNDGQSRLFLNDGAGGFADATATHLPASSLPVTALALGDVDSDGDVDAVLGGDVFGRKRLYLNTGNGVFDDVTATHLPGSGRQTEDLALADLDGDGDLDLVAAKDPGHPEILRNDGTGRFEDVTTQVLPPGNSQGTNAVAIVDVDGDGDQDLILGEEIRGCYGYCPTLGKLYLNDGSGTFTNASRNLPRGGLPEAVDLAVGDVDGDGDPDLVVTQFGTKLYLNDGAGVFVDAGVVRFDENAESGLVVALEDLDRDGDPDLLIEGRVWTNLLRQADAPAAMLRPGFTYQLLFYARYGAASAADTVLPLLAAAPGSFPLPPFGTLLLDPTSLVALPGLPFVPSTGVASLKLSVPNLPGLAGATIHAQGLIVQATGARFTNATASPILP